MSRIVRLGIVSDIHYAGPREQLRGNDYEYRDLKNFFVRNFVRNYRHFFWLRKPLDQNHLLDQFMAAGDRFDFVVANGDYSCNSAFVGVSDDAACESAGIALTKLRERFGDKLRTTWGDHELGKTSFFGGRGGMRLTSWQRARTELGLAPFWRWELGNYVVMGVASSLIGLPVFEPDTLPEERAEWWKLREEHLAQIREGFAAVKPGQRVLFFVHDPTALPFLWREEAVRAKLDQIEATVIGHLHSKLILWKSRLLSGMPRLSFLGHTTKRLSSALREAKYWRPFKIQLCPALSGIELLKDGGYLEAEVDATGAKAIRFEVKRIQR